MTPANGNSIGGDGNAEPTDPASLDLMAYLDGELAPERVAEVEQRLVSDPVYARKLRGLVAVSDFVREDAGRVYAAVRVDAIVDEVIPRIARMSAPPSAVLPLSSVATRRRKNTVIWATFGVVAAAAAAFFLYLRTHDHPSTTASIPQAPAQTVASKSTDTPTTKEAAKLVEEKAQEVEDLEVGEGATVIYRSNSSPIVWVTKKNDDKSKDENKGSASPSK